MSDLDNNKPRGAGRPSLADADLEQVYETLNGLKRKTQDYRAARLQLAVRFGRTERGIDTMFDRVVAEKAKAKAAKKGAA